jgi:hypothetical protein
MLSRQFSALLPVRFGSVMDTPAALRDFVARHREALTDALARVDGCEQMTMRVVEMGRVTAARGRAHRTPRATSGAAYLRGRLAAARQARTAPEAAGPIAGVAPLVRAERIERLSEPPFVAAVYHLIPRGEARRYRRLAAAAPPAPGYAIRISGPFPPFAFAPEELL